MRLNVDHLAHARQVADAVLYEGYLLYPYHQSSQKNQVRFQFVLPEAQGSFIGLHICQQSAQIGRLLSGHPAMLIQVDCLFGHDYEP